MKRIPEFDDIVAALVRLGPFQSDADANRALATITDAYNSSASEELGGLSPDQVGQLLHGNWTTTGAVRVSDRLTEADVVATAFCADARTLLAFVRDAGVVKETAAKYLPPAFVAQLLPVLRMPVQRRIAERIGEPPPKKEADVLWLPVMRYTLMFAGLLLRRKGLRVSSLGKQLLDPSRAGALYSLLFRTLFREYDLSSMGRYASELGLQRTLGFSLYKLRHPARQWASQEELARAAWLPTAKDPPNDWAREHGDFSHYTFAHRVLEPLEQFGLLESRVVPGESPWDDAVEFRRTPLYDRALRFEFTGTARRDQFLM